MANTYKYNDASKLTEHFSVSEFRCKCGRTHDTLIDPKLPEMLEKLRTKLGCKAITVNSGYRCAAHDKSVGGGGSGMHTKGLAADIVCIGRDGKPISSKIVSCAAQYIGFCGIANIDSSYTAAHLDVRTGSRWFGNEVVTTAYSVTDDFYSYYKLSKADVYGSEVLTGTLTLGDKKYSVTLEAQS